MPVPNEPHSTIVWRAHDWEALAQKLRRQESLTVLLRKREHLFHLLDAHILPQRVTLRPILERYFTADGCSCFHQSGRVRPWIEGLGEFKKKTIEDSTLNFGLEGYAVGEMPDMFRQIDIGGMSPARLNESNLIDAQNAITKEVAKAAVNL
jgi:hypothetical protein